MEENFSFLLSQLLLSVLIWDCAAFWHELWHPSNLQTLCMLPFHVRTEEYIIFASCLSLIYSKNSSDSQSNMHVKGCPETYTRIRCHVLLSRLLVNVSKMQQQRQKHPQMCDITFAEITLFVFFLLILSLVSWVNSIWECHILDDAVSNLSCANEWHSDSFEGLC